MNIKKIVAVAVVIILVIAAAVKLKTNRDHNLKTVNLSTNEVTVSVANADVRTDALTLDFTGTLCPSTELDIPAETSGKITSLNFKLGQHFGKGAVIALIDNKLKTLAIQDAKIDLEKLKKDYDRTSNLYKGGTASEQEYDHARIAYESARNKLSEAERQLAYTRITAPISGVITKKIAENGTYVNPGTPIATIVDVSRLKVKINVSESNVYYLHTGDRVKITTDIYRGTEFSGRVSFVSPRGDDAHNFPVEVEISNSGRNQLKGGTFVNVQLAVGANKQGLYIPREALQGSIKEAKVYVAENGRAVLKNIIIGRESNERLEVLSGISPNDKVIVSGQVNLSNNQQIKIVNTNN